MTATILARRVIRAIANNEDGSVPIQDPSMICDGSLDYMDTGTEPLPTSPGPAYVAILWSDGKIQVTVDNFDNTKPAKSYFHTYAGWHIPGTPAPVFP